MRQRTRWLLLLLAGVSLLAGLLLSRYGASEEAPPATEVPPLRRSCADIEALSPRQRPAAARPTATALPLSESGPAPTEDRIGFPTGYEGSFTLYFVIDRPDLKEVRVSCANPLAALAGPGQPLPYGSVFLMESWSVATDERGTPIFDATGHLIREELMSLMVMRKSEGFGEAYGEETRTGEWEYVAYRPDGSYLVPPQQSHGCAVCHRQHASAGEDWLFRRALFFRASAGSVREAGPNEIVLFHYLFRPVTATVRVGTTLTWSNLDEVSYTITATDGSFDSGLLAPGEQFSHTFKGAGRYEYSSSLHPEMRGTILVTD